MMPAPPPPGDRRGRRLPTVAAAGLFVLLGLGAGWLLFGQTKQIPVSTTDTASASSEGTEGEEAEATGTANEGDESLDQAHDDDAEHNDAEHNDADPDEQGRNEQGPDEQGGESADSLTVKEFFEEFHFERFDKDGSPFTDSPFGELPLDDLLHPDDLEELRDRLDKMPTRERLEELFGDLEDRGLKHFLDEDGVDDMKELLDEWHQLFEDAHDN